MRRFTWSSARWFDVRRTTRSMTMAVTSEMRARLANGGQPASGPSSRSKTHPSAALSAAITRSRNVAEAFQLLLDVFLGVRFLELRDLFLEAVRDELLD